jgi:5-methylcytosine-specific restriction endonuclease McrA
MHTLLLNADLSPLRVAPWTTAVELLFEGKAYTVEPYAERFVRSERLAIPWPAVAALKRYTPVRPRVKFSPRMVILRDSARCSYCGVRPQRPDGTADLRALTLDHVVPRAQARNGAVFLPWSRKWVNVTCWENGTTACAPCNARKDDRAPDQAGMTLRAVPRVPTQSDVMRMAVAKLRRVPAEWLAYLPETTIALVGGLAGSEAPAASTSRALR